MIDESIPKLISKPVKLAYSKCKQFHIKFQKIDERILNRW